MSDDATTDVTADEIFHSGHPSKLYPIAARALVQTIEGGSPLDVADRHRTDARYRAFRGPGASEAA